MPVINHYRHLSPIPKSTFGTISGDGEKGRRWKGARSDKGRRNERLTPKSTTGVWRRCRWTTKGYFNQKFSPLARWGHHRECPTSRSWRQCRCPRIPPGCLVLPPRQGIPRTGSHLLPTPTPPLPGPSGGAGEGDRQANDSDADRVSFSAYTPQSKAQP